MIAVYLVQVLVAYELVFWSELIRRNWMLGAYTRGFKLKTVGFSRWQLPAVLVRFVIYRATQTHPLPPRFTFIYKKFFSRRANKGPVFLVVAGVHVFSFHTSRKQT